MAVTQNKQGFTALNTGGVDPSLTLGNTTSGTSVAIGLDSSNSGIFSVFTSTNNPTTLSGSQFTIDSSADGHIALTPNGTGTVDITNANIISGTITLTSATVGNINIASNTISSTNTNGHIILSPNGIGTVDIADAAITGGTINSTIIGGSTAAAGTFTTAIGGNVTITTGSISTTNNALTIDSGTGAIGISTDSTSTTLSVGTGSGNKQCTFGSLGLGAATTLQCGNAGMTINSGNGTSPGPLSINSGTAILSIGNDTNANTIRIGTGAADKTIQIGSSTTSTSVTIQSGGTGSSGIINLNSNGGNLDLTSGTGTIFMSTDSAATTVNIATGAAAKSVTLGSTNTTSSTAINSGSGNIILNSGFTVNSSGITNNAVQPAFQVYQSTSPTDVTGDGTTYTLALNTANLNQGSYFNTSTFTFTAPVAGFYQFNLCCSLDNVTVGTSMQLFLDTTAGIFYGSTLNPTAVAASGGFLQTSMSAAVYLAATNTVSFMVVVSGGAKTIDIQGGATNTYASGYLVL